MKLEERVSKLEAAVESMVLGIRDLTMSLREESQATRAGMEKLNKTDWNTIWVGIDVLITTLLIVWGGQIRPVTERLDRMSDFNRGLNDTVLALSGKEENTRGGLNAIQNPAENDSQLKFIRLAGEDRLLRLLWKNDFGNDLPPMADYVAMKLGAEK